MFTLIDSGTLDTVVECSECGCEERFASHALIEALDELLEGDELDDMRVQNLSTNVPQPETFDKPYR